MHSASRQAVLCCAVLCCAVLCCAVLCCAVLCYPVLCCIPMSSDTAQFHTKRSWSSHVCHVGHDVLSIFALFTRGCCRGGLGASGHSSRGAGGSGSTTASQAADKALASAGSGQGSPPHSPSATSPVFSLGGCAGPLLLRFNKQRASQQLVCKQCIMILLSFIAIHAVPLPLYAVSMQPVC